MTSLQNLRDQIFRVKLGHMIVMEMHRSFLRVYILSLKVLQELWIPHEGAGHSIQKYV